MQLNETQCRAVEWLDKDLTLIAGAGSGKTRVLTERYLHILRTQKATINEILTITFTDKAALEMQQRIEKELLASTEPVLQTAKNQFFQHHISTIHSFCLRLLKEYAIEAHLDPQFTIMDDATSSMLVEQLIEETMKIAIKNGDSTFFSLKYDLDFSTLCQAIQFLLKKTSVMGLPLTNLIWETTHDTLQLIPQLNEISTILHHILEDTSLSTSFQSMIHDILAYETKLTSILAEPEITREHLYLLHDYINEFKLNRGKQHQKSMIQDLKTKALSIKKVIENKYTEIRLAHLIVLSKRIETQWTQLKKLRHQLEMNDLLVFTVQLLTQRSDIRQRIQKSFSMIMVDEFQDINWLQYQLIMKLKQPNNLMVVGDIKQSIYRFNDADVSLFQQHIEQATLNNELLVLDHNYRSDPTIIELVNLVFPPLFKGIRYDKLTACISNNTQMTTPIIETHVVTLEKTKKERSALNRETDELAHLAIEIKNAQQNGTAYQNMAILVRNSTGFSALESALSQQDIPYQIIGGSHFYSQKEIISIISFLQYLSNPSQDLPLLTCLSSPIANLSLDDLFLLSQAKPTTSLAYYDFIHSTNLISPETLREKIANFLVLCDYLTPLLNLFSIIELLDIIFQKTHFFQTIATWPNPIQSQQNINKLRTIASSLTHPLTTLPEFIRYISRLKSQAIKESEAVTEATQKDFVSIMTIHKAKGLEFSYLFLPLLHKKGKSTYPPILINRQGQVGLSLKDDVIDIISSSYYDKISDITHSEDREEEKRILYVALTRAQKHLYLSGTLTPISESTEENLVNYLQWVLPHLSHINASKYSLSEIPIQSTSNYHQPETTNPTPMTPIKNRCTIITSPIINLTVTALNDYAFCPRYYYYIHELQLKQEYIPLNIKSTLESNLINDTSHANESSSIELGRYFHKLLAQPNIPLALPTATKTLFTPAEQSMLNRLLKSFYKSTLPEKLNAAKIVLKEQSYIQPIPKKALLFGQIDLVYQDQNSNWHLIDYKTTTHSHELEKTRYKTQLNCYIYALSKIQGIQINSASLFFLHEQVFIPIDINNNLIETSINALITGILMNQFNAVNIPKSCSTCGFNDVCTKF